MRAAVSAAAVILTVTSFLPIAAAAAPSTAGLVERVADGDTIVATVDGVEERVRFLNIDTPEVGTCMADQATDFTSVQLPAGEVIALRYDRDLRDPYERLLALVKPAEGEWLSVSLAERGLGFPLMIAPNSAFYPRVVSAANRAKRGKVGMFSPTRTCTPIARTRRANALVSQAASAPVRTRAQYEAANRKLNRALAVLALAAASRYGVKSAYFTAYTKALMAPVRRRANAVRASNTRQWNIVRNASSGHNDTDDDSSSSNNGGWWPPGVSHSYTGPRCYEPGGVIWYPC
ncbi:thermonuclease family protein [Nocardioides glacieisoli]|nr:thermonuclease family protein [Nocardioides glacieisoli]